MRFRRIFRRRNRAEEVHLTPLEQLQNASRSAVFMITNTISELRGINEAIEQEQIANTKRIMEIEDTQKNLELTKESNAKIVSNFESLLR